MKLMVQFFLIVLINSLTSTMLLLIWRMLRKIFMAVNPKMIYTILRGICFMYLLPVGYIVIVGSYRVWFQGKTQVWKLVFAKTEYIINVLQIFSVCWFIFVLMLLTYRYIDNRIWCRKLRDNIPERERRVIKTFHKVCRSLGISKDELFIHRNVLVKIPMIVGVRHPLVLLPEHDYTTEELEIIFYHELSHYKHKDLKIKMVVVVIMMIHCFNPVVYFLLRTVNFWSECMADVTALETSGRLHHAKVYFDNIMKLLPKDRKTEREKYLFSTLYKNDRTLIKRAVFMKKYQKVKSAGKCVTAVLVAAFILCSTVMAVASARVVADIYRTIYQVTEDKVNEKTVTADDGIVEHYCNVEKLDLGNAEVVSDFEDIIQVEPRGEYYLDWAVKPKSRHISCAYELTAGQEICVAITVSSGGNYCVGIIDDDGNVRYVDGQEDSMVHKFAITEKNNYRVFIQNNYEDGKGDRLKVIGNFRINELEKI